MVERRYGGNIFLLPDGPREAAVVTTNGMVKSDGTLVMGAGIAKYCRDRYRGIDALLGQRVRTFGNVAQFLGAFDDPDRAAAGKSPSVQVVSMPTKNDWRRPSEPGLIRASCRSMAAVADRHGLDRIYLPAPGCSNGQLDYARDVRAILMDELDARFVVCLPDTIWYGLPDVREPEEMSAAIRRRVDAWSAMPDGPARSDERVFIGKMLEFLHGSGHISEADYLGFCSMIT